MWICFFTCSMTTTAGIHWNYYVSAQITNIQCYFVKWCAAVIYLFAYWSESVEQIAGGCPGSVGHTLLMDDLCPQKLHWFSRPYLPTETFTCQCLACFCWITLTVVGFCCIYFSCFFNLILWCYTFLILFSVHVTVFYTGEVGGWASR